MCTFRKSTIVEGLELIRAALAPAGSCGTGDCVAAVPAARQAGASPARIGRTPPRLLISPTCKKLIAAFQTYHFPPPESAHDHSRPIKDGPDHFIDALRYFFVNKMRPNQETKSQKY
jgi:hypothetical protein